MTPETIAARLTEIAAELYHLQGQDYALARQSLKAAIYWIQQAEKTPA